MRTDKSNLKMRKEPVQSRSDFTVNVILEAATKILTEQGIEQLTTTEVAGVAGVSVGSIYQYFPGEIALIAELRRRHRLEITESLQNVIDSSSGKTLEQSLRSLVKNLIDVHAKNPKLHQILVKNTDLGIEVSTSEPRFSVVSSELKIYEEYFIRAAEVSPTRAKTVIRVIYEIVESLIHAALIHKELRLANDELLEEIMCVLTGYFAQAGIPTQNIIE